MSSFSLNTGHQRPLAGFENRTTDVFASLGDLEKGYDGRVKDRDPDEFVDKDRDQSPEKDGDGSFKRPSAPRHQSGRSHGDSGSRHWQDRTTSRERGDWRQNQRGRGRSAWRGNRNRTPDHELHPERWTAYSLEDTDISSESGNKRAAVDFFRDLRTRKAKEARSEEWDAELYCSKIEFKKPTSKSDDGEGSSSGREKKGGSYSTVHKMPEYVIGQAKPKSGKSKDHLPAVASTSTSSRNISCSSKSKSSKSNISLGHLGSYEDGEQVATSAANIEQVPTRSAESLSELQEGKESCSQVSRTLPSESPSSSVIEIEERKTSVEDTKEAEEKGKKEEKPVAFKKGKGKRKIRERRDDDEG